MRLPAMPIVAAVLSAILLLCANVACSPRARVRATTNEPAPQLIQAAESAPNAGTPCPPLKVWPQAAPGVFAKPAPHWPSGSAPPPPPIVDADMLQTENWAFAFQTDMKGVIHGNALDRTTGEWKRTTLNGAPKMIDGYTYSTPSYYPVDDKVLVIHPSATVLKGALYDPVEDTWTRALPARDVTLDAEHLVPLGRHLFAWRSGAPGHGYLYEAAKNAWIPVPATGAPHCPSKETVLRFGAEILVHCESTEPQSGAWFNAGTRTWRPLTSEGAPGRRSGARVVKAGGFVVVWGGYRGSWPFAEADKVSGGAAYDVAKQRWTEITVHPGRPLSDELLVAGEFLYWTRRDPLGPGAEASAAEYEPTLGEPPCIGLARMQTTVTTYDLRTARWRDLALCVDGRPLGLDDARLFAMSGYNDLMAVADLARETVCRYPMGSIPFFSGATVATRWQSVTVRDNRVWIWGRVTFAECPSCPLGAPCLPCEMKIAEQRTDGVVLEP